MKCIKCQLEKSEDNFSFRSKSKNIRHNTCQECHREYSNNHYRQNSQKYKAKALNYNKVCYDKYKNIINSYKSDKGCIYCKETDYRCLDFHHISDKSYNVSRMIKSSYSLSRIMEEINKCEVICSNCHRKLHYPD